MSRKSKNEGSENPKIIDLNEMPEFLMNKDPSELTDEQKGELLQHLMKNALFGGMGAMSGMTEKDAETSDDFVMLANLADDEKTALKYAKKAKKLDPDNLDADEIIIGITAKNAFETMTMYKEAAARGAEIMKKSDYVSEDDIGDYWLIFETRPYMRTLNSYMHSLIVCGMMGEAVKVCKEMLRLCEGDNLGVRYTLMHLYAYFEDEESALELWNRFEEYDGDSDGQFLMPVSVLYFKKGEFEKAEEYLSKLAKTNKDLKKFIKSMLDGSIEETAAKSMGMFGYRPDTVDELMMMLAANIFLYSEMTVYFEWANEKLRPKRKTSAAKEAAEEKKAAKKPAAKKKTSKKSGDDK